MLRMYSSSTVNVGNVVAQWMLEMQWLCECWGCGGSVDVGDVVAQWMLWMWCLVDVGDVVAQ